MTTVHDSINVGRSYVQCWYITLVLPVTKLEKQKVLFSNLALQFSLSFIKRGWRDPELWAVDFALKTVILEISYILYNDTDSKVWHAFKRTPNLLFSTVTLDFESLEILTLENMIWLLFSGVCSLLYILNESLMITVPRLPTGNFFPV